ncbi:MAG: tyrosine-type recombinase/integrase [Actinomycetota bacterium]
MKNREESAAVSSPMLTSEFLLDHWLPAISATVRPSTFAGYRGHVVNHIVPRLGAKPLNQLNGPGLNLLLGTLLSDGNCKRPGALSPVTVRRVYATLHRALGDAVRWGLLDNNPADACDPPRCAIVADQITTWDVDELRRFLDVARDDHLYALWFLLATTGLRRGEALGLRWRCVDLEGGALSIVETLIAVGHRIQSSTPKSARGRRVVVLDAPTVHVLRAHMDAAVRAVPDDFVFQDERGNPLHPLAVTRQFRRLVARAHLRSIRLHDLRHTHATLALKAGVHPKIVSERLGHSTVSLTLDIYSHALPSLQREAAARFADLVFPNADVP